MRIDVDTCRDPELLAREVRRLRDVIGSEQTLTDEEWEALQTALLEAEAHQHSERAATLRGLIQRHSIREKHRK